jgi:hypothetical protein
LKFRLVETRRTEAHFFAKFGLKNDYLLLEMQKNKNSFIKKSYSIIGVILIGALGSGLWEVFLKNFIYNTGNLFVEIMSHFYRGYIDSLYKYVGKTDSLLQYLPSILVLVLIIISPILMYIVFIRAYKMINQDKENEKESIVQKIILFFLVSKRRIFLLVIIFTLPLSLIYTDILVKEVTYLNANHYIERTLEIIRPYIEDSEYILMRSEFRQIDNKGKFIKLYSKIKGIALKENITIPQAKFYGID